MTFIRMQTSAVEINDDELMNEMTQ